MTARVLSAFVLVFACSTVCVANVDLEECFRRLVGPFTSWSDLFELREQEICNSEDVLAEAWADNITKLLDEHWDALDELASLAPSESPRRSFVLHYIDVTCPRDRCARIDRLCEKNCPTALGDLCAQIRKRIAEAE